MDDITIREATVDDSDIIYPLLKDMREGEGLLDAFIITPEEFKRNGFGENKSFEAVIVEDKNKKEAIGFATYFFGHSGYCGRVLYLDDIYIKPAYRSKGYGTALFKYMAKITIDRDARRMEWVFWTNPRGTPRLLHFTKSLTALTTIENNCIFMAKS